MTQIGRDFIDFIRFYPSNPRHPCSIIKKLAFCKKIPIFESEQADKFIQSFSLSGFIFQSK